MQIHFHKYQATGNDFIMVDHREHKFEWKDHALINKICNRRFGIGSDGLILIKEHDEYDFEMIFFNPDGSRSLCGNGSRCAVKFAQSLGLASDNTQFLAHDGPHSASTNNGQIKLKMKNVDSVRLMADGIFVDTGSPHYVQFVADVQRFDVFRQGKSIRNGGLFGSKGTNVNFVEILNQDTIFVRTYERGVENETLSCGTGVTASALAANYKGLASPIKINTLGGTLKVEFSKAGLNKFSDLFLIGPAEYIYKGEFEVPASH